MFDEMSLLFNIKNGIPVIFNKILSIFNAIVVLMVVPAQLDLSVWIVRIHKFAESG